MSLTSDGAPMLTMPVEPAYGNGGNNGGGGWGGDGAWWIILFFIFAWGWGGNGFGGFGGNGGGSGVQGALTRGDLCMEMSFQDLKRDAQNTSDAVSLGFSTLNSTICNQQYDTARMINGLENTIQGGFNAMNISNLQTANAQNVAQMQGFNGIQAQIAQCCCDEREAIAGVNYNLSTQACDTRNTIQNTTRDLIDNQNANTRAILDKLTQQEIAAKDAQITAQTQKIFGLELAASQAAQNNYLISRLNPTPVPAYPAASPCGLGNWSPAVLANGYGYNGYNGCGCGCGCNG